jgi:hypothetical protein
MTLTGALNGLSSDVLTNVTGLLDGAFGGIIATVLALGVLIFVIVKFKGAFSSGR